MNRANLIVSGQKITFFYPEGDDTIHGTLSCLQNNKFHLNQIPFNPDDIFVDIGCNVGLVSIVAAVLFPAIDILAFDASATAIECLKMSIKENGFTNIRAYNFAIGADDQTKIKFYSNGKDKSCLIEDGLNGESNMVEDCESDKIKIDTVFDLYCDGREVKYLKMDIEGGEFCIFERLFNQRRDLLEKINLLHLEVHEFTELGPQKLRDEVKGFFGDRVCFDT